MKKSTLLSLLTATAIVLTSAGTYATWDSLTAKSSSNTLNFRNPITISVGDNALATKKSAFNTTPTAEGTVKFTVANTEKLAKKVKLTPSVKEGGVGLDKFDIKIKLENAPNYLSEDGGAFIDEAVAESTDYKPSYTVEVTPKDSSVAGQDIKIDLTATLAAN